MEPPSVSADPAPSRQKNCNGCVSTKRRCDRRVPVCTRCAERKIPCIYNKTKAARQGRGDSRASGRSPSTEPLTLGDSAYSPFPPGLSFNVLDFQTLPVDPALDEIPDAAVLSSVLDVAGSADTPMGPSFMDVLGDNNSASADQWLISAGESHFSERPGTPVGDEVIKGYQKMAPFCENIEPWHLYDPTTPLHYITTRVKSFTADIATRNSTPFLHRYLYKDHAPPCILSCFATCVLYENRTPANTAIVIRSLQTNVRELLCFEGARVVATPVEKLARTQALFMYQVIRLFDGDIMLRAQGEEDMALLETWLGELCRVRENLGDLALLTNTGARNQPPEEWERWIFAESVRRTIVMAYSVMTMYEVMRNSGRQGEPGPWGFVHRWTLARSLWEAGSAFEFRRVWRECPQFVIANYAFETFLEHGRGEDVDDFAETLLCVSIGVDALRELISSRPD